MTANDYRFWLPLSKSGEETIKGQRVHVIEGIASTEDPDLQNEIVVQKGMDFEPFLEEGYLNWDHREGPENIIGEPLEARIIEGPSLYVKGFLYPDVERAIAVSNLLKSQRLRKSNRKLGWSVEGRITERDSNRLKKSIVQHIAVTHQPVNTATWAELVKSMTTGNAAPLRMQNLDAGAITTALFEPCKRGCHNGEMRFKNGIKGAFDHLTKCQGYSEKDVYDFLKSLHQLFY